MTSKEEKATEDGGGRRCRTTTSKVTGAKKGKRRGKPAHVVSHAMVLFSIDKDSSENDRASDVAKGKSSVQTLKNIAVGPVNEQVS